MTLVAELNPQETKRKLQDGWRWVRLADLVREAQGGFACGARDSKGVVQLRMNNVTTLGSFDWSSTIRVPADEECIHAYQLRIGDVLFNNTNSTELVGKTALFGGHNEPVVFSNHFTRIRTIQGLLLPDFLAFWLQVQWRQGLFAEICNRWIGQSAVQRDKLLGLMIPLPPIAEQKRIASVLDEQIAAVEQARAAAEAQLEAAKALPAAYLRTIFDSPHAQKWPRIAVGNLGDQQRGSTVQTGPFGAQLPSSEFGKEGVPVLNIGNVQWGSLELTRLDHVSAEKANSLERYRVRPGDLLFTRSGTIGRCAVVPGTANGWLISYHLLRVALSQDLANPDFIACAIRGCAEVQAQVRLASRRGSTRDGVNSSFLSSLRVPLPPIAQQNQIVAVLKKQIAESERIRNTIEEQVNAIAKLEAALLRRAFSGKFLASEESSFQPVSRKGVVYRRGALAGYIVNALHTQKTFGRVMFEKALYLTEAYVGVDLQGEYLRDAAGPLDSQSLYRLESLAGKKGWFTVHARGAEGYFYRVGPNIGDRVEAAERILGEKKQRMDDLLHLFSNRNMDSEKAEIIATLFAAWNDFLLDGHSPTDQEIIKDVRVNWHPSKRKFTAERLSKALKWMRESGLIPRGIGPHTKRREL